MDEVDALTDRMDRGFRALGNKMEEGFDKWGNRIQALDLKVGSVDDRMNRIEGDMGLVKEAVGIEVELADEIRLSLTSHIKSTPPDEEE